MSNKKIEPSIAVDVETKSHKILTFEFEGWNPFIETKESYISRITNAFENWLISKEKEIEATEH